MKINHSLAFAAHTSVHSHVLAYVYDSLVEKFFYSFRIGAQIVILLLVRGI